LKIDWVQRNLFKKGRSVARPPQSRAYLIRLSSEC